MNQGVINKMRFLWRTFFPPRDILAEMEALDGSEIGIVHYLRCMAWRFKSAWKLISKFRIQNVLNSGFYM